MLVTSALVEMLGIDLFLLNHQTRHLKQRKLDTNKNEHSEAMYPCRLAF